MLEFGVESFINCQARPNDCQGRLDKTCIAFGCRVRSVLSAVEEVVAYSLCGLNSLRTRVFTIQLAFNKLRSTIDVHLYLRWLLQKVGDRRDDPVCLNLRNWLTKLFL